MKYFILAGEASGSQYGADLAQALFIKDAAAEIHGVGGEEMKTAGVSLLFGLDRLAFMGFVEVAKHMFTIRRNFKEIKKHLIDFKPDIVILIDYPGFNLRMAKWCKLQGFKVVYYISPQIWAWKENRVETIKKYVDCVLCILPFEQSFYEKHHYNNAYFVGHPLLEHQPTRQEHSFSDSLTYTALLPGSRKQEIVKLMPHFVELARRLPHQQFRIAALKRFENVYANYKHFPQNLQLIVDDFEFVVKYATHAVVCSGTATLQTALWNIPQVVVYKTSYLNYQIGKRLAKVNFISLPNLIMNKEIVKELLQKDCTTDTILQELNKIEMSFDFSNYAELKQKLGEPGVAERVADKVLQLVH